MADHKMRYPKEGSASTAVTAALMLFQAGCGAQVDGDYKGEKLLTMAGAAALSVPARADDMTLAICWNQFSPEPYVLDLPELLEAVGGHKGPGAGQTYRMAIQPLESVGSFPADFRVQVYEPPGDDAFSPEPLVDFAIGELCAVKEGYDNPAQEIVHVGSVGCDHISMESSDDGTPIGPKPEGMCRELDALIAQDLSRYYFRTNVCQDVEDPSSCHEEVEGDDTLLQESRFENVLGYAQNLEIQYHRKPVQPGTYAAWRLGNVNQGAEPGFYILAPVSPEARAEHQACVEQTSAWLFQNEGTPDAEEPYSPERFQQLMIERCPSYQAVVPQGDALDLSIEIGEQPQRYWILSNSNP